MRYKLLDVVVLVPLRCNVRRPYHLHHFLMVIILIASWIHVSRSTSENNVLLLDGFFNDVEYENQRWVFEMINIGPVWSKGIFGKGVRVRVNDAGIDENNIEFQNRYDKDSSCTKKPSTSTSTSTISNSNDRLFDRDQHGTSVASIIGASANNGECAMGVAPETIISWCDGLQRDESFLDFRIDNFDISQNSYERDACRPIDQGDNKQQRRQLRQRLQRQRRQLRPNDDARCPFVVPGAIPCRVCNDFATSSTYYNTSYNDDNNNNEQSLTDECVESIVSHCDRYFKREEREGTGVCSDFLDLIIGGECSYDGLSTTARNSIVNGIRHGRNGKGIIYVFSSGNAYQQGDDTNLKGYTNARWTISVGAVGKDGTHAFYSTGGASLFVTAPGGDSDDQQKHIVAQVGGGCTSTDVGTSFAAPVVSGVVALVLEVNPTLSWRDVQGILAESATKPPVLNNDTYDDTSVMNGGGLWHSNLYGFGIVNAGNAVELSKTWINYGEEQLITIDSGPLNLPIIDDPTVPTTSSLIVSPRTSEESYFVVESIEILLDVVHFSRGDLNVTLTSPSGISSLLHPGKLPENIQSESDQFWKLMTVRNRDESPFGEWQLHISDEKVGQFQNCVDMTNFIIYYDNKKVDCRYLEKYKMCSADAFLGKVTDDNGQTMSEACCICGGGLQRESFQDILRHWTIAIYGRYDISRFAPTTKKSPPSSSSPEVSILTKNPTNAPSSLPSILPTTTSPTYVPSEFQSTTPTLLPTTSEPSSRPTVTASSPSTTKSSEPSSRPTLTASSPSTTKSEDVLTSDASSLYPSVSIPSARPSLTSSNQPNSIAISDESEEPSKYPSFQSSRPTVTASNHSTTKFEDVLASDASSLYPSISIPSARPSLTSSNQPNIIAISDESEEPSKYPSFQQSQLPTAVFMSSSLPSTNNHPSPMIPSTILSSKQMLTPESPDKIDEVKTAITTNEALTGIVIDDNSSSNNNTSSNNTNNKVDLVEDDNSGIGSILVVDDSRGDDDDDDDDDDATSIAKDYDVIPDSATDSDSDIISTRTPQFLDDSDSSSFSSTTTTTTAAAAAASSPLSSSSSSSSSAGGCSFRSTCSGSLRQVRWFSYKPLSSYLLVVLSTVITTITMGFITI